MSSVDNPTVFKANLGNVTPPSKVHVGIVNGVNGAAFANVVDNHRGLVAAAHAVSPAPTRTDRRSNDAKGELVEVWSNDDDSSSSLDAKKKAEDDDEEGTCRRSRGIFLS